jgi:hypothetical protein
MFVVDVITISLLSCALERRAQGAPAFGYRANCQILIDYGEVRTENTASHNGRAFFLLRQIQG